MPLKKSLTRSAQNVASPKNLSPHKKKEKSKYVRIMIISLVMFSAIYLLYILYHQDKIKINRYMVAVGLLIFFIMMQSRIN